MTLLAYLKRLWDYLIRPPDWGPWKYNAFASHDGNSWITTVYKYRKDERHNRAQVRRVGRYVKPVSPRHWKDPNG